jgi:ribonuclease/clavin/mitogillin
VSSIFQAASVLLARGPGSPEVFVVHRSENLRFFGGFIAFPGGKVHADDATVPVTPAAPSRPPFFPPQRIVAAARELFEETGVLVARRADGSLPGGSPDLGTFRLRLLEEAIPFAEGLAQLGLTLCAADFQPIGGITTPPFVALRFDTAFFVAHLPPGQEAVVWPGELAAGEWTTPHTLLERWRAGTCLVSPPTIMTLEMLEGHSIDEAPARLGSLLRTLAEGALHSIYFAPAVQLIPLDTQSLPPSTHTNAYLVGQGPRYLLDPGTALPSEQVRLFELLDAQAAAGHRLTAIVLTHHHPDHVGAAAACAARYQVPVFAHPWTAQALRGKVTVAREINDGDRLDLGVAPDGSGPWHLQALHTPGHAPGHLAFYEPHYRLLFAGDMVSTLSSVVIAPPEGDITVYLQSLNRLRSLDCRMLLPAHGGVSARPGQTIDECIAHRAKREQQLLDALSATPRTVAELSQELYRGLPDKIMYFAELQLLAGLQKLEREGSAIRGPAGWCRGT